MNAACALYHDTVKQYFCYRHILDDGDNECCYCRDLHTGNAGMYETNTKRWTYYTSMKSWRGYIFTADCLCVCLSVCVSGSACEQNSSRTDEPIWTRFSLNVLLKLVTLGQRSILCLLPYFVSQLS